MQSFSLLANTMEMVIGTVRKSMAQIKTIEYMKGHQINSMRLKTNKLNTMLKWARKKMYQRMNKPLVKHANETYKGVKNGDSMG